MKSSKKHVLSIDVGSQSVKAIVFDLSGSILAKSQHIFEPYKSIKPGWVEQEGDYFWQKLGNACQEIWRERPDLKESISGVALTTQRGTLLNVDEHGNPLRAAITWMDKRRTENIKPNLSLKWRLAFALSGLNETINYFTAEAEALWIAEHEPEILEQTHKYLLLSGFLTHKLCGRFVDSTACQVGYLPYDYKRFDWCSPSDWKWEILDSLRRNQMPDLVLPGETLGEISAVASKHTGIPAGLPLIAAAADKACEALGSGAFAPDVASLSFGTTATISTTHATYIEPIRLIPPYPAAVPQHYSLEVGVYRGFWMVSWFKEEFGHLEKMHAAESKQSVESYFDTLIRDIPAGCDGLMLQPYWAPGLRVPGPEARGALIGWTDSHTRAHMYKAILEGIVFALKEGGERIEQRSKVKLKRLVISGGGAQSDEAMQIGADMFGLPVSRPKITETSALGAAIVAAVGLGHYSSFEEAVTQMTHPGQTFEPIKENYDRYQALYKDVYRKLYGKLRGFYRDLGRLTWRKS